MALTESSISSGRQAATAIRTNLSDARYIISELKNTLNGNENYNLFVTGTNYGKAQDQKLQNITKILDTNLTAQTTYLLLKLSAFFNQQEEINRRNAASNATGSNTGNLI